MNTLTVDRCPVCGAGGETTPVVLGSYDGLCQCRACSTVHSRRYTNPDEVYVDGYLFGGTGYFGLDVRHPRLQEYLAGAVRRRLNLIERHVARGSVVDVGCGTGETLAAYAERGWNCIGVEPIADASAFTAARGVPVRTAVLEDSGLPERSFDVVSAMHVLEHIPDSKSFLELLARWARPGGHVVVEVPNYASRQRRHDGDGWALLQPLEHVVHFTPMTLATAFERAGLQPLSIVTPTYVGPPQTLDEALRDLSRPAWRKALAKPSPRRPVLGELQRAPSRPVWAILQTLAAVDRRRGQGAVIVGIACVP
jgi:SAM-dependent methyltransferase